MPPIKVTLKNKKGKIEDLPGLDINKGECVFPFFYKDEEYDDKCFEGKKGAWCATEVNPKSKTVRKWAYCLGEGEEEPSSEGAPAPKKATKPTAKKKINTKKKKRLDNPFKVADELVVPKSKRIIPKTWMPNNRKAFVNWFDTNFEKYRVKKGTKFVKGEKFSFFNHQKIIQDYMSSVSPYRGLLLYHGLGVGKTCGSIGIAEGFRNSREIVVLLNKSLTQNFRENLKFCGYDYFRTNQHWIFHKFTGKDDPLKKYARVLGIPLKRDIGGAWFIDFEKPPNYSSIPKEKRDQIDRQINDMIDKKFTFLPLDGLQEKRLQKMKEDRFFDNKVLIVDEVHNLTNAMSKSFPGIRARYLYDMIMNAEDLKLIFLSGTPMINNLFETAKLFNMLRGYIVTWDIQLLQKQSAPVWAKITSVLETHPAIDQLFINKKNNTISLTRVNPEFKKTPRGLVVNEDDNEDELTNDEFTRMIEGLLPGKKKIDIIKHTAFPESEEQFMNLFFDPIKNRVKNEELFKRRILGLVSYYRTQDKSKIPTVRTNEVIEVPMSDYQFGQYATIRKVEIENDKRKGKSKKSTSKKEVDPEKELFSVKSSYRAYSRMHCSFVFPESIPRPYPLNEKGEVIEDATEEGAEEKDAKKMEKDRAAAYEVEKGKTLRKLDRQREDFLVVDDPEKLLKYSPKYNVIIDSVNSMNGTSFIYTEYKTLEGIAVLSICLKANGFAPFSIKKNESGNWVIDEAEEDRDKPKYAFWGEKGETSELIRRIYNNDFEDLPPSLREGLKGKSNLRGGVIKVLLTTKTGAEGIDLKNVRQVHIVEPYWNPVRMKQVMGRAVRVGSHLQLPPADRLVDIYTYLAVIPPDLLAEDRTIQMDSGGNTSDQALYDLSQKKLSIMDTFLKMIKEASVDCSLNYNDTINTAEPFTCLDFGSSVSSEAYSFIPDIKKEIEDKDLGRVITKVKWTPKIIKAKVKGKMREFALKPAPPDEPQLLFNVTVLRNSKRSGQPIGEIIKTAAGKTSIKFYAKSKKAVKGGSKKKRY